MRDNIKWGSLLWRKWENGFKENVIRGYWFEDGSEYQIIVPYQLRPKIIEIQNWLSSIYTKAEELEKKLNDIERWFNEEV